MVMPTLNKPSIRTQNTDLCLVDMQDLHLLHTSGHNRFRMSRQLLSHHLHDNTFGLARHIVVHIALHEQDYPLASGGDFGDISVCYLHSYKCHVGLIRAD